MATQLWLPIPGGDCPGGCGASVPKYCRCLTEDGRNRCSGCLCYEGELHDLYCDMERCPFCGGQLSSCGCRYRPFYPAYDERTNRLTFEPMVPFFGLPEEVYAQGLPPEQNAQWEMMLERIGRCPYIVYPNLCSRCGTLWPDMFHVPSGEWEQYVMPRMRRTMLCRPCYDWIVRVTDEATMKRIRP